MPVLMHKSLGNAQQHLCHKVEKHLSFLNVSLKSNFLLKKGQNVDEIYLFACSAFKLLEF